MGGSAVECSWESRDDYDRPIAKCTVGEVDLNRRMVRDGWALAFVRYSEDYVAEEAEAKAAGVGLWSMIFEPPWEYRATRWETADPAAPDPNCPIKGNINRDGEKIYHMPWMSSYAKTRINEAKGERWFCDEAEAQAAGWRPPKN